MTKMDIFPLPRVDDTLDMLSQTQYFSTLDLAAGYWQVVILRRKRLSVHIQDTMNFEYCHLDFVMLLQLFKDLWRLYWQD